MGQKKRSDIKVTVQCDFLLRETERVFEPLLSCNRTKVPLCGDLTSGFAHILFLLQSLPHITLLSWCPGSCCSHQASEVGRQGFLVNPPTLGAERFEEVDSPFWSHKRRSVCLGIFDGLWFQVVPTALWTAACWLLTSFLRSLSFCNSHLMEACGDLGEHSRKVVLFFTPYWTISAAFLYPET